MNTLMLALVAAHTVSGAATIYVDPYLGQVLYCSTPQHPLYYDAEAPPWIALPVGGDWQCGDVILVRPKDAPAFTALALDTGPFGDARIGGLPIVADAPYLHATWPMYPGWTEVELINLSAVARECRARGYCD